MNLSAVFWGLTHDTGESSPNLGPGISRLTLVTGLTLTPASTPPRPNLQQVLAGLLSIDLTSEWPVRGEGRKPPLPPSPTPAVAQHAGVSRAALFGHQQQQSATHGFTHCVTIDCRRGCVTASGGG